MKINFKHTKRRHCFPLTKMESKNLRELNYFGQQLPIVKNSNSKKVTFDLSDLDSRHNNWSGFNTICLHKGTVNPGLIKIRTERPNSLGYIVVKTHYYYLQ